MIILFKKIGKKMLVRKILVSKKVARKKIDPKFVWRLLINILVPPSPRHRVKCPIWLGKGGGLKSLSLDKPTGHPKKNVHFVFVR